MVSLIMASPLGREAAKQPQTIKIKLPYLTGGTTSFIVECWVHIRYNWTHVFQKDLLINPQNIIPKALEGLWFLVNVSWAFLFNRQLPRCHFYPESGHHLMSHGGIMNIDLNWGLLLVTSCDGLSKCYYRNFGRPTTPGKVLHCWN